MRNLEEWFLVELTYTSNALEGNTLTRKETAAVVEKGLTVGGKTLVEHLEATNHAKALKDVLRLSRTPTSQVRGLDILQLHETVLHGIDDANAGHYRTIPVRISGSPVVLPNPVKVPDLMDAFIEWIVSGADLHPVELAAEAHYQLVTIHPFVDGNGRTARLLMNLILMQNGYPPAIIRTRDRLKYFGGLEKAQLGGAKDGYRKVIEAAVDRSLEIYLKAAAGEVAEQDTDQEPDLLRIGQLARETGESNATIRYWTKEGLLQVADSTDAGYQLYHPSMIERVAKIRELQGQRYTLSEIRGQINQE
ncbi:Fic family protein [Coraliomargarita algicola]|uniref:Fic family protein n=1 Tax=Coraliomargarita algicola TaxID=3092156 RepID=A0ABZ0RQT9_9BACT|nr:Fic family protein [Coraliomargarita sp. J2-16]WPJ97872.1 Fic family protein [Coraliomargarita sp. J2-16]